MTVAASTPARTVALTSARDCHVPSTFRSCRSSRLQRFPPQRMDPRIHPFDGSRVCCTPQPAVGFTTFRTLWSAFRPTVDPEVVDPKVRRVFPCGEYPSKLSPPRQPVPCRHRPSLFRAQLRSPAGVPSRRSTWTRSRVATLRFPPRRPQGLLPPRSPLRPRSLSAPHRSMLPWALDRTRFPMLPRASRRPDLSVLDVSPRGSNPLRRPRPDSRGRQGVSALSGSCEGAHRRPEGRRLASDGRFRPEGRCVPCRSSHPKEERARRVRLRCVSRKKHLGLIPHRAPKVRWDASRSTPRGKSTASVQTPEGVRGPTKSRRLPEGRPSRPSALRRAAPVVRAPPFLPSAVARVPEGGLLAARSRSPEGDPSHAHRSRVASRGRCVEPTRQTPEGIDRAGEPGATRRWSLADSRFRRSAASCGAGLGPDSHLLHRTARTRSEDRSPLPGPEGQRADAEAPGVRLVPHIPPAGGDPPRAPKCSCRNGPWPIPGEPDRSRARFSSVGAEALSENRPV
jgi:hypothetical protein